MKKTNNNQRGSVMMVNRDWAVSYNDLSTSTINDKYFTSQTQNVMIKAPYGENRGYKAFSEIKIDMSNLVNAEPSGNMYNPQDLMNAHIPTYEEANPSEFNLQNIMTASRAGVLAADELVKLYNQAKEAGAKSEDKARKLSSAIEEEIKRDYSQKYFKPVPTEDFIRCMGWLILLDKFHRSYKIYTEKWSYDRYKIRIRTKSTNKEFVTTIPFTDIELGFVAFLKNQLWDLKNTRITEFVPDFDNCILVHVRSSNAKADIPDTVYRLHDVDIDCFFSQYSSPRDINLRLVDSFIQYWR